LSPVRLSRTLTACALSFSRAVRSTHRADTGASTRKVVPAPGALLHAMVPPIWSTSLFHDGEPQPGAAALRDVVRGSPAINGSKRPPETPSLMPTPVSRTSCRSAFLLPGFQHAAADAVGDRSALGRVFHGVGEQVEEDLVERSLSASGRTRSVSRFLVHHELLPLLPAQRTDDRVEIPVELADG
jgi:hypothetical protein